nr:reverse transcriptase domain-containing protein [Tanacetum cinerariifolium]
MRTGRSYFPPANTIPHHSLTSTFRHPEVPNTTTKLLLFPFSLEGEARIWLDKEPPRSILTWEDLVSKFINQFFPPSKTTYLRNEITNFLQKPNETFNEAWERFKDLLRQCPHHGFSELHQLNTFYNALNPNDQDVLDSAAKGNFLDKIPRECLSIIERLLKTMLPAGNEMVEKLIKKKSYEIDGIKIQKDTFQKTKKAFNGQQEFLLAPNLITEEQIYNEHVEKNVAESLVKTLLNVSGKTKDRVNARLDLAELGVKPELFAMQEEDKTTLPPAGYTLTNAEKDVFCKMLYNIRVERELAISKESVSETVRWISYGPRATIVKYDAYNMNGAGGVKDDTSDGYTLVDLNNLGYKTPPKNYKDTYNKVDEEFSTVIHQHNDNILPRVDRRDLGNESRNDYYGTDCGGVVIRKSNTNKEDTIVHTGQDRIHECHSPKSKAKYVPVLQKYNPNVKSPIAITGCVLGLPNVDTWDDILKKFRMRTPGRCVKK